MSGFATGACRSADRSLWCKRLARKEELLHSLESLMEKFGEGKDVENFFYKLAVSVSELVERPGASFFLLDGASGNLILRAFTGKTPRLQIISPSLFGGDWNTLLNGRPVHIPVGGQLAGFEEETSGGWLFVPLVIRNQPLGIMMVEGVKGDPFFSEDEESLHSYIRAAGLVLENNFLYRQIFRGLTETLQFMVSTLEARDLYTKDHSMRVTRLALLIADVLGCTPEEREMLDFAGRLHDIGKVAIQDYVLLKSGQLNMDEWDIMKQHPIIGEQIVRPVCLLQDERAVVRHHHEWWNGEGYPDHLSGEAIPLLARILSVADAFDAMTSDRPYRPAMTPRQAIAILDEAAGIQFDFQVVSAFRASRAGAMAMANGKH